MTALASVQTSADYTVTPGMAIVAVIAIGIAVAVFYVDRFIKAAEMDRGIEGILDEADQ